MIDDILKSKDMVEKILDRDFLARDNDKHLLLEVWREQGLILTYDQMRWIMDVGFMPESIRRVRQKLQEGGKYPGHKKVQRTIEEAKVKDWTKGLFPSV